MPIRVVPGPLSSGVEVCLRNGLLVRLTGPVDAAGLAAVVPAQCTTIRLKLFKAVLGVSMGAAAVVLASPLAIDALVIESVYADVVDAVRNRVAIRLGPLAFVPVELLLMHWRQRLGIEPAQLRPIARMPDLGCPVFVVSGGADRHTMPAETRAIFDAAVQPKELWLVDGAGHVDLHAHEPLEYQRRMLDFLDRNLRGP